MELRNGCGFGAPFLINFLLIGMFLALEAVPQGGPKWTQSIRPNCTSLIISSWTQTCVRSNFTAAAFSDARFKWWSTPIARPPSVRNCAHTPAVPQKSSSMNGGAFAPTWACTGSVPCLATSGRSEKDGASPSTGTSLETGSPWMTSTEGKIDDVAFATPGFEASLTSPDSLISCLGRH